MKRIALIPLLFVSPCWAQSWSTFLDPTRATDWTPAGFSIPNYTSLCSVQPSLTAGSGADSTNATQIQNSIASCDSTHNVVSIPAGTWYVTVINMNQSNVVLRGVSPTSTKIIPTVGRNCAGGLVAGLCMWDTNNVNYSSAQILPGGSQACSWTAGYTKGATSLTLASCGGAPPVNSVIVLDQADDTSDTSGLLVCNSLGTNCTLESGDLFGRQISGVSHSLQQTTKITGVTSLGGGSYTVTISPGLMLTNIRGGQSPGAFWFDSLIHIGVENLTIDGYTMTNSGTFSNFENLGMVQCNQCWVKNVQSMNAGRNFVGPALSYQPVIRDSYFFHAMSGTSDSYGVECTGVSGMLIENNIFQQTTAPILMNGGCTGNVTSYNYSLADFYTGGGGVYAQGSYFSHQAGNELNLFEGNNFVAGPWGDSIHGSSNLTTLFRNMSPGWYTGKTTATQPFIARARVRGMNIIGGVYGQPGYHTQYQSYTTSTTAGVGAANEPTTTIYSFGWPSSADQGCTTGLVTNACDSLSFSTAMRWGNYDIVTAGTKWDSTEASPGAVTYISANFSSGYFGSLAHILPASFYYSSTPSWWPSGKAWPPIGPDVSSGNVGTCSGGSYQGAQATSPGQCTGGTITTAWASHVTSIPAQDCYLATMNGPPDGTGGALNFNANLCYVAASSPSVPVLSVIMLQ